MSVWDTYLNRIESRGGTKRETVIRREKRLLRSRLRDNPSYQTVMVFDPEHGYNIETEEMRRASVNREVAIINSDNLNEKYIMSMPDEDIGDGSLVYWMGNHWLVTERDANTTMYTRAKMIQCNHLLKWVSDDHRICEQWCIIEDGTKLKRIMRNSLARRKRRVKSILLIAGNPLEVYPPQRGLETKAGATALKRIDIGQSAAKLRTGERSTTIPEAGVGASAPKRRTLNRIRGMVKI